MSALSTCLLMGALFIRDDRWSESIAVGGERFVEQVKIEVGFRAEHRQVSVTFGDARLVLSREAVWPYADHFDSEK